MKKIFMAICLLAVFGLSGCGRSSVAKYTFLKAEVKTNKNEIMPVILRCNNSTGRTMAISVNEVYRATYKTAKEAMLEQG